MTFLPGDPRASDAGRKGRHSPKRYEARSRAPYGETVFDVMDAAGMTGPTWEPWRSLLRTSLGLPHSGQGLLFYRAHTNRETPPTAPVSE